MSGPGDKATTIDPKAGSNLNTAPNAVQRIYAGLCGVDLAFDQFEILPGLAVMRQVADSPTVVQVFQAADLEKGDWLDAGRFSGGVGAEVAIEDQGSDDEEVDRVFLLGVARHLVSLLKLRGHGSLFCPVCSAVPWGSVGGFSDNQVRFQLLDDVPRQSALLGDNTVVTVDDVRWVRDLWGAALDVLGHSRRLRLALDVACTWNFTDDLRIGVANLWFGLEALFSAEDEVFGAPGTAEIIKSWLPAMDLSEARDLVDGRADVVRGGDLTERDLWDIAVRSDQCLRLAIVKCLETGSTPLPDAD